MTTFEIPACERPRVSIIVLSYGTSLWLQRCLQALVANTPPVYELIVVDNGSPDDTREILERHVSGARVVLNDDNVGFGPANNQAALVARAPALCFLNADALVQEGWLEPLLAALDAEPELGAVVPMLLNWDDEAWANGFRGTLQEAGSIVGHDGTTQAVGYGDDPDQPWYRFPRIVDYGSAACMVVGRSAFEAVGGFDPAYAPAYFEDVDLCFSLDAHGWQTRYEPRSEVIHVRGVAASHENRTTLLQAHQVVLTERWRDRLARRPSLTEFPAFAHRSVAARDAVCTARVLVAGDGVAAAARLAVALPRARITVVADAVLAAEAELLAAGGEVVAGPRYDWVDFFERRWFQYDVAIGDAGPGELATQIVRTQPQAVRVAVSDAVDGVLAEAGVVA